MSDLIVRIKFFNFIENETIRFLFDPRISDSKLALYKLSTGL